MNDISFDEEELLIGDVSIGDISIECELLSDELFSKSKAVRSSSSEANDDPTVLSPYKSELHDDIMQSERINVGVLRHPHISSDTELFTELFEENEPLVIPCPHKGNALHQQYSAPPQKLCDLCNFSGQNGEEKKEAELSSHNDANVENYTSYERLSRQNESYPQNPLCVANGFMLEESSELNSNYQINHTTESSPLTELNGDTKPELCSLNNETSTWREASSFELHFRKCLSPWQERFNWAVVHIQAEIFVILCRTCSACMSTPYTVSKGVSNSWFSQTEFNLFVHSNSKKHLANTIISSEKTVQKIYTYVKSKSSSYLSKEILYKDINSIIKNCLDIELDEFVIISVLKILALNIEKQTLANLKERQIFGVSYAVDPCRRVLIVRYLNEQKQPEEHVITDFANSSLHLKDYLVAKNIPCDRITFVNQNMKCGACNQCTQAFSPLIDNTLPVRFPTFSDLCRHLLEERYLSDYYNYVASLNTLVKENVRIFENFDAEKILWKHSWTDLKVLEFLSAHETKLKELLICIRNRYKQSSPPFCAFSYMLDKSPEFGRVIEIISLVKHSCTTSSSVETYRKMEHVLVNSFMSLKQPYANTIKVLRYFLRETQRPGYHLGRQFVQDFRIFFQPQQLALLKQSRKYEEELNAFLRVYFLFRKFLSHESMALFESLLSFGTHLFEQYQISHIHMSKIMTLFYNSHELRHRYHGLFALYSLMSTLPFFQAETEKSFYCLASLDNKLQRTYGDELGRLLFIFETEGRTSLDCRYLTSSNFENKTKATSSLEI